MQIYALAILGLVSGERILGSFILSYNGDRLTKPRPRLTSIGAQQSFESGEFYHNRYFNEFPIPGLDQVYNPLEFSVMLPLSDVHEKSMRAWTQGFYPKLTVDQIDDFEEATFNNGTQYVHFDSIDKDSSRYWIVNGNHNCYRSENARDSFMDSAMMNETKASTYSFYQSLAQHTTGFAKYNLTFVNAQAIYDHFLVQGIHNESFSESIGGLNGEVFQQVKTLQDIYSVNYNTWNNNSLVSGMTFLCEARWLLGTANEGRYPERIQVMAASSDQFYQVFKLLDLYSADESRFTGIINYAATFVIELFTPDGRNERFVRVGIRNGTTVSEGNVTLDFVPVLNRTQSYIDYPYFDGELRRLGIGDVGAWCNRCLSSADVCLAAELLKLRKRGRIKTSYLSLAGAGSIGAGVTIGVFLVVGLVVCCVRRRPRKSRAANNCLCMESQTPTVPPPPY